MNIHSPEFAKMQRERIYKTKPWLKTKGAVTPEGKAKVKMNALKQDPAIHQLFKEYKQLMKEQKQLFSMIATNTDMDMNLTL